MDEQQKPVAVAVAKAVAPSAKQERVALAFVRGQELGAQVAEHDVDVREAIASCKSKEERAALREGFIDVYPQATGKTREQAIARFDYLARAADPSTSRKAKHNASKKRAKGGGRKSKTGPEVKQGDAAKWNAAALHYIARMNRKHAGDDELLEVLGSIAAILGGRVAK